MLCGGLIVAPTVAGSVQIFLTEVFSSPTTSPFGKTKGGHMGLLWISVLLWNTARFVYLVSCSFMIRKAPSPWKSFVARGRAR
jgi:hypothetical protein